MIEATPKRKHYKYLTEKEKQKAIKKATKALLYIRYIEQEQISNTKENGYLWNAQEYIGKAIKELKKCN